MMNWGTRFGLNMSFDKSNSPFFGVRVIRIKFQPIRKPSMQKKIDFHVEALLCDCDLCTIQALCVDEFYSGMKHTLLLLCVTRMVK